MWTYGDSGGPVVVNFSSGWRYSGIITGIGSGYYFYNDIYTLLSYWNVQLA